MEYIDDGTIWRKGLAANQPSADDPGYGLAVFTYAEAWANAIEAKLSDGAKLADVAESCEPKGHGITGFQHGAAVATLRDTWQHGAALNDWHNVRYGHAPGAKGTVNPAVMTINVPD